MQRLRRRIVGTAVLGTGLGLAGMSALLRPADPRDMNEADAAKTEYERVADVATSSTASFAGAGLGPEWDLPNLDHPRIDYWVARFDTVPDMREKFEGFLERGAQWAPLILERLEARGMPLDLLYLAMIESGFDPVATSSARAVGIWQFISATGQRFGLAIDRAVDERRDPVRATEAALDYLEVLHRRFGSWYLAAAAYNTGEGRVGRIMRQQFGRERARSEQDYYRIWSRLPRETRDYVPLMIAAARITKDPAAYGFEPMRLEGKRWEEVTVPPATRIDVIAHSIGTTETELRVLNPHLLIYRTPNNRAYDVRVPVGGAVRLAQSGLVASRADVLLAD
jgi:membrane-bound lytic murein transglycosylase D